MHQDDVSFQWLFKASVIFFQIWGVDAYM